MTNDRKLLFPFLLITLILLLRDTPYVNVLVINRLWVVYVLFIVVIAFFFIPRKGIYLLAALFFFFLLALILILIGVKIAAEVIGIAIYVLLWLVVLQKIFALAREKKRNNQ